MPDVKGYPYPNASAVPDGPLAFQTLATELVNGRTFRRFATWAAMDAVGDAVTNELAIVDAVPGAWFKYDGTDWVMDGIAKFADATARDAALPTPAAGMRSRRADATYDEEYDGTAWVGYGVAPSTAGTLTLNTGVTAASSSVTRSGNIVQVQFENLERAAAWTAGATMATIATTSMRPLAQVPFTLLEGATGNSRLGLISTNGTVSIYGSTGAGTAARVSGSVTFLVA